MKWIVATLIAPVTFLLALSVYRNAHESSLAFLPKSGRNITEPWSMNGIQEKLLATKNPCQSLNQKLLEGLQMYEKELAKWRNVSLTLAQDLQSERKLRRNYAITYCVGVLIVFFFQQYRAYKDQRIKDLNNN